MTDVESLLLFTTAAIVWLKINELKLAPSKYLAPPYREACETRSCGPEVARRKVLVYMVQNWMQNSCVGGLKNGIKANGLLNNQATEMEGKNPNLIQCCKLSSHSTHFTEPLFNALLPWIFNFH